MSKIDRRTFIGSASAALMVGASGTAIAEFNDHPDAELLRLGREFDELVEQERIATERVNELADARDGLLGDWPDAMFWRQGDAGLGLPHPAQRSDGRLFHGVSPLRDKPRLFPRSRPVTPADNLPSDAHTIVTGEPWPEAQARADEIVAAWDDYWNRWGQIERDLGLETASDQATAITNAMQPLIDAILPAKAHTIEGIAVKARVAMAFPIENLPYDLHYEKTDLDVDAVAAVLRAVLEGAGTLR